MQIGRNDPCPCGSGKKYKKCHLEQDEACASGAAGSTQRWHDLDGRLVADMGRWASRRFGDAHQRGLDDYPVNIDVDDEASGVHLPLFATWLAYERKLEGRPLAAWYLAERGQYLAPDERRWLEQQGRAWLSIWGVIAVQPGEAVEVKDLLTGEQRRVVERSASKTLETNMIVLARVMDIDGVSLFCGMHPSPMYPVDGRRALEEARRALALGKKSTPERLREGETPTALIDVWDDAVHEVARRPMPRLANTEGEDLVVVEERFVIRGGEAGRAELQRLLEAEKDIEADESEKGRLRYTVLRTGPNPSSPAMTNTVVGSLRLNARELIVETNSRERADRMRDRLRQLGGDRLGAGRRRERTMEEMMAEAPARRRGSAELAGPEVDALIKDFKARHYASWPDEPLPALDGLSPREAVGQPQYRSQLATMLEEMEMHEAREPEARRFDFGALRRELGLG